MQAWLYVGNAKLFALMCPSPTLFLWEGQRVKGLSNVIALKEERNEIPIPNQISFCNFLRLQGRHEDLSLP